MPHDVATQWNLTFDILHFALVYCMPLDGLTDIEEMKLSLYELSEEGWKIADQLAGVLDVSYTRFSTFYTFDMYSICSNKLRYQLL